MSITSLQQLGATLISPMFTFYNQTLVKNVNEKEGIFFLAREGYWLSRAYSEYCETVGRVDNSQYMLVSRAFLFKIGLTESNTFPLSLNFKFEGSLYELMCSRFMLSDTSLKKVFSDKQLQQTFSLPDDLKTVSSLLVQKQAKLKPIIEPSSSAYHQYLTSIGFFDVETVNLVDLGYSGTIQTLLTILFKKDTKGHYLIASNPGKKRVEKQTMEMVGYLKGGVKMGGGYTPLDRSMFLESLLTAPVGQFQDIRLSPLPDETFDTYYGRKVTSQHQFHLLAQVCQGALKQMNQYIKAGVSFSAEEVETLYTTYVTKKGMLPTHSWPLFTIDDDIASEGTVNGLDFFGLKI
ncbi:HAD family hydrolase [Psychromonas sp. 14N.309.X.WAT.B.A12]|uniref:HAD family hydrolase n=1 Tax=Psychromonas sp. 14N.309.X.WAT.B.A12 TaxID=2998322 RepID=UPI0025B1FFBE|nr:HAD family hydrolase [Psychromonas sp. 14N.309.X.WAT.B.A12]MDN2664388.1 HAD family hydrolase [Psychromonas sp. 14N.309.X.WAT.B.A12]